MTSLQQKITVWILGDQLLKNHSVLEQIIGKYGGNAVTVLLIESRARIKKLPYHRKKIVLLFSAMRHYAVALRARGIQTDCRQGSIPVEFAAHLEEFQPDRVEMMAASEYGARMAQKKIAARLPGLVTIHPNMQFLVEQHDPFPAIASGKRVIMENFYRSMRKHFRILVDDADQPTGGKWNFDHENRKPLPKHESPPLPRSFPPDDITQTVIADIANEPRLTGEVSDFAFAVTHEQARQALDDFISRRLPRFGDYEDAMTTDSLVVYHSTLSIYLNIGLLTPSELLDAAVNAYEQGHAPLNAVEGFVRQVLGWREYIYWMYWRMMPELTTANDWDATRPMPAMFWTAQTDMNCIRHVTQRLLDHGYSHHIERLMIVCNFCLLAGINPIDVSEWFLSMYADAYEWVVLPNVIGMGLNADGGMTATKPYIASANYISKMSNYCAGCRYHAKQRTGDDACPYNFLYWNFIISYEKRLRANPRFGPSVLGLKHLTAQERKEVQQQASTFLDKLEYYESLAVLH